MCSNKCAWCLECPSTRSQFAANGLVGDLVAKKGYSCTQGETLNRFFQVLSCPHGSNCCSVLEEACPFCFDKGSRHRYHRTQVLPLNGQCHPV